MTLFTKERGFDTTLGWIQEGFVVVASLFYLLLFVRPMLILEALPPVFLLDANFFTQALHIPGGATDWISALLMQFWFSNFLIALFLSVCFWLIAYLTRKWIETLNPGRPIHTVHLIPACLLLVLQSQYYFPLSITVALIINLIEVNLFIRWAPKQQTLRAIVGFVESLLLFWLTGGAFLVFVVLCGTYDMFFNKKIASGLAQLLLASVLPYAGTATIFLVPLKEAYLHNLIYESVTNVRLTIYLLPGFFAVTLLTLLLQKIRWVDGIAGKVKNLASIWKYAAGTLLLICGTIFLRQASYNRTAHFLLQINNDIEESRWVPVLESAHDWPTVNGLFIFQTNIALYKSGLLLDKMFAFPQSLGPVGLLMDFSLCSACSEQTSNFYWMLGLVSESQHWAHEAYEQKGRTPDLLKRLGEVYMLKGDNGAAKKYLLNLKKIPFEGATADRLLALNEHPSEIGQDPELHRVQSCMPIDTIALTGKPTLLQLQILLDRNPINRMAFEYMIAYHLLTGNLRELMHHIPEFAAFGYPQLPVHVQEALLVIASQTPNFDVNILSRSVQRNTYDRFMQYQQTFMQNHGSRDRAMEVLRKDFSDTYWYYLMFVKPAPEQSEGPNVYTR